MMLFLSPKPRFPPANVQLKTLCAQISHHLFDEIPHRAVTSHNPIDSLRSLLRTSADINPTTVAMALKSSRGKTGTQIHGFAVCSGLDSYVTVNNSLMNMYSKSGLFALSLNIFNGLQNPDVVSWNTILCGFSSGIEALQFAATMRRAGVPADAVTITTALAFSADLESLEFGMQLHSLVFKSGLDADIFVGNSLITAYSRSSCLEEAKRVFDEMGTRDLVSWNALISGLTQQGECGLEAIGVFVRMVRESVRVDHISFASAVAACGQERHLSMGCQIHGFSAKLGLATHVAVSNVLMAMYYKHGEIDAAVRVFSNIRDRNVISWTTMISIDAKNAVPLFNSMRLEGVPPNDVTFVALIYALPSGHCLSAGQMIHGVCFTAGISAEVNVSNSLITMYAKLKSMEEAAKIFERMNQREIISWNALISGYAQNGLCEEALTTFSSLIVHCHCQPNQYTFGSILSAIASVQTVSLAYGQRCHCRTIKLGLNSCEYVSGALIDMYSKRGIIEESQRAFDETAEKSLISWTAIISAHAKHGDYWAVMRLFGDMVNSGVRPDRVTFLALLMACGGRGMVDAGRRILDAMVLRHGLEPWPEHYACLVDMLGRAGRLSEAEEFVKDIPKGPGVSALQSLLGACRVHGDVEIGERVAQALMEMEPTESGAYVLMSNMYADKGEWENVAKVRKGMRERGVKKEVAFSWVDVGMKDLIIHMHKFSSGDKTHPMAEEIYRMAECLGTDMQQLEEG